jgi:hypothetical protein
VVLTAAGEGKGANLDLAAEKAVKNLHCIYTNAATFTLLSQIWSAQLQSVTATGSKQRLFQELEKQGRIAQAGDVKFLAAQKYIEASSIAFDAQFPDEAIALADKARKIVTSLESSRQNETAAAAAQSDEEMEVTADLRCRIFTLSGIFRATQLPALKEAESTQSKKDSKKKGSKDKKKAKSSNKAEERVLELLHRAVFRDCKEAVMQLPYPAVGPVSGRGGIAVEHLPIAINHLVSLWTARVNNGAAISAEEGAQLLQLQQYSANLTSAFYIAEVLRSRTRYADDRDRPHCAARGHSGLSASAGERQSQGALRDPGASSRQRALPRRDEAAADRGGGRGGAQLPAEPVRVCAHARGTPG